MDIFNHLVVANSLTDWIYDFVSEIDILVKAVLGVAGAILAVLIISKNPTAGRVITGLFVGGVVAALPWLVLGFGDMVRGEVEASAQVIQEAPGIDDTRY